MFIVKDDMIDHEKSAFSPLLPGHRWRMPKEEAEKYAYRTKREALQVSSAARRNTLREVAVHSGFSRICQRTCRGIGGSSTGMEALATSR